VKAELVAEQAKRTWVPPSVVDDLVKAVPDSLVRDLVSDIRKSPPGPGMLPEESRPVKRGTGWAPFQPLKPYSGIGIIASDFDTLLD